MISTGRRPGGRHIGRELSAHIWLHAWFHLHALVEGCAGNAEREGQEAPGARVEALPQASLRRRVVVADQLLRRDAKYHLKEACMETV